ncbi:ABC transporter ATP-binding protein [uncultured Nitratireductor sp.]|uniref:oligopeptide/dipeptide ABC transporter ATP-binding protein n=1 Tax=uncultured Nitratireductor sp. TaxID=520953 RepID=UPI0025DE8A59|nr:ABC transporter ATP-binding protein [uncultured Nitratireductor sp.]
MSVGGASDTVLKLADISVRFPSGADWLGRATSHVHALNGVNLDVRRGETLGIVGESGCGKSTLAQVLLGLLQPSAGQVTGAAAGDESALQIVFQDPQSSLNSRMRVWRVITEPVFARQRKSTSELRRLAVELAAKVGLREETLDRYPHEFSGGQRQRIAIARALSSDPDVIVLDEPTSALDISVQAQILNLLEALQRDRNLTYIFISHDISVISHMCRRVAVMYLGQIVEIGAASDLLTRPRHPYTQLLLGSVPTLGEEGLGELIEDTELPSNRRLPSGCFFFDRCAFSKPVCRQPQRLIAGVRCCRADELANAGFP